MRTLIIIFAMSGNVYNDVLALVSIVGTLIMFLGSLPNSPVRRYIGIGEWSLSAVFFGVLFQLSMVSMELIPERIGFVFPMAPARVNGLFAMSITFLIGYWWLRRKQTKGT